MGLTLFAFEFRGEAEYAQHVVLVTFVRKRSAAHLWVATCLLGLLGREARSIDFCCRSFKTRLESHENRESSL